MNEVDNNQNNSENNNNVETNNPFIPNTENGESKKEGENEKFVFNETTITAALSYLHFLVLVPFFMKKDNPFIRFHVKQGFILVGLWIVFYVFKTLGITIIFSLILLAIIGLSIYGLYNVFLQRKVQLPLIGKFSDKIDI